MDDLFDLDDFSTENQEKEKKIETISEKKDSVSAYTIKQQQTTEINEKDKELNSISNININLQVKDDIPNDKEEIVKHEEIEINTKHHENIKELYPKQEKQIYAIEDKIDIKEYDKITDLPIKYNFELDIFQKRSIIRINNHENVLVCAHTSSGKTVVAEYAIAMGKKNQKRVLYTSPIKALSNQKYREFKEKFGDVGILTGDVSINPDSQCLIMTTEILQSSLYKTSNLLNMVDYVIFDEVHYINDNERGHVWEEILILLPPSIGIVMLSATIPNYLDFANWVGRIKNTVIYIQNTTKRIVPLEHKLYVNNKKVFVGRDTKDLVIEKNIEDALKEMDNINNLNTKEKNSKPLDKTEYANKKMKHIQSYFKDLMGKGRGSFNRVTLTHQKIEEMTNYLISKDLTPAVFFVFSLKKIDEYSKFLSSNDYATREESSKIISFFDKCVSLLSPKDRNLNQIRIVRSILIKGIGIHHAGLIPILKEIIEILYSKGLIKILFATTSFAIGLNMPTRTVIFTEIEKFNEDQKVMLTSSEYLQMCGRAGRRGIDTIGHIFILVGDKKYPPRKDDIVSMMKGGGDEVESKFRLSYKTIIQFLSRNTKDIMTFFKESFLENNLIMMRPDILNKINHLKEEISKTDKISCFYIDDDRYITEYIENQHKLLDVRRKVYIQPGVNEKLSLGRIILVYSKNLNKNIYVIVIQNFKNDYGDYMLYCLLASTSSEKIQIEYEKEGLNQTSGITNGKFFKYFELFYRDVLDIVEERVKLEKSLLIENNDGYAYIKERKDLDRVANDIININLKADKVVNVDYLKSVRNDATVYPLIKEKEKIDSEIKNSKCTGCSHFLEHYKSSEKLMKLTKELQDLQKQLSEESLKYNQEFQKRIKILDKLEYIDSKNIITIKGKAARELSTTDCVMITELLFSNIIENLSIPECVAFICGFAQSRNEMNFEVPQEKSMFISKDFLKCVEEFQKIVDFIVNVEKSFEMEENKYNRRVNFTESKAIFLWMSGRNFSEVIEYTDLEEGKFYNLIMRLYILCEEIKNFYAIIQNTKLFEKFSKAREMLIRDIFSCKSLYLQDISLNV